MYKNRFYTFFFNSLRSLRRSPWGYKMVSFFLFTAPRLIIGAIYKYTRQKMKVRNQWMLSELQLKGSYSYFSYSNTLVKRLWRHNNEHSCSENDRGSSPLCNTLCKDLDRKIMKVTNELVKRVGTLLSVTHNEGTKPMNSAVVKRDGGVLLFLVYSHARQIMS